MQEGRNKMETLRGIFQKVLHINVYVCVCVLIISGGFYNHDYMYKLVLFKIIWYYQHKAVRMEMTLEIN